jgi:hypothetical protein
VKFARVNYAFSTGVIGETKASSRFISICAFKGTLTGFKIFWLRYDITNEEYIVQKSTKIKQVEVLGVSRQKELAEDNSIWPSIILRFSRRQQAPPLRPHKRRPRRPTLRKK